MFIFSNTMLESLLQLWLSDKEARIYELLSSVESLTAASIARQVGIKRASIYELLHGLEKKNLISYFRKHKTQYFYIDTPEKLILQHQAKLKIAEEVVKNIRSKKRTQTVAIEVHRDKEGFSELYREILTGSGKEFCAWSNFESFDQIIDKTLDKKWTLERVKKWTRPRLIMVDNQTSREFQKQDSEFPRTTKLIDAKKNFSSTLVVRDSTLYLFDIKPDVIALKIQHPNIAMMIQEVFDTYWSQL